jgi:DNA (cytosine-5)-methyltransferase 1
MLDGQVYELVMQALLTSDSESLSLPTPRANEPGSTSIGYGDSLNDFANRVVNGYARKDLELLRTPVASEAEGGAVAPDVAKANGQTLRLSGQMIDMVAPDQLPKLPTPTTRDYKDGTQAHERDGKVQTDTVARAVFNSGEVTETNWGKFELAIRRWETIVGRPAPEPTKPDGKDGNHRLSSKFTEWMMGLPDGWITDIGLKRNDELKACGNGVVPQQAELALSLLGIKEILER